jgi:hypothetical protein
MGAHPWSCTVPYQADINAALAAARAQEFAAGRYSISDPDHPPATIEEAREEADADGTGSVLDMLGVIDVPHEVEDEQYLGTDYGMVAPLSRERLLALYGTEKPGRSAVVDGHEIYEWLDRGIGSYVVIYDGETPTEIYFAGYSYD